MRIIETEGAPKAIGPYSQAISTASGLTFLSGQIGINPSTGKLVEGGIAQETKQIFDNIDAILTEAKLSFGNIVRVEVFLTDMEDFATLNEVYSARFGEKHHPARFTVAVSALPAGASVEIAVICSND